MTADERIARVLLRVDRAEEHLSDLDFEISRFLDGDDPGPCEIGIDRDPNTQERLYYVANVKTVPSRISVLTGDVLQNCRTALDHLAYQFFLVGSPGLPDTRATSFPICESATAYESEKARKVKGMRDDAIEFINAVKPYKGSDGVGKVLWPLHALNNLDKHRLLIAAVCSNQGRSPTEEERRIARGHGHPGEFFIFPGTDRWNTPVESGYVFHVRPANSKVDKNMKLRVEITFAEPAVVEREPVLKMLNELVWFIRPLVQSCGTYLT